MLVGPPLEVALPVGGDDEDHQLACTVRERAAEPEHRAEVLDRVPDGRMVQHHCERPLHVSLVVGDHPRAGGVPEQPAE